MYNITTKYTDMDKIFILYNGVLCTLEEYKENQITGENQ